MLKSAIYLALGLADWFCTVLLGPPPTAPGAHPQPPAAPAPSIRRTGWAVLVVAACILVLALVLPHTIPPLAHALGAAGPDGLLGFALVVLGGIAATLAWLLYKFLAKAYRNGKAIYEGARRPAWRR